MSKNNLRRNKMKCNEVYSSIKELFNEFEENHEKFVEKGNKSAGARARKAIGGIKKLVTDYRKSSVDDSKV